MGNYTSRFCLHLATQLVALLLCTLLHASGEGTELINTAKGYLSEREHGYNRSTHIDTWNRFTGVDLGSPYCASFISYMHHLEGVQAPVSAWAPDQVRKNSVKFTDLKAGDVFGIYFPSKQRVAHVGFVDRVKGAYLMTVEANTSPDAVAGSASDRDGQGVYARRRPVYLMKQEKNKFSRYWNN